jgi:hypothetical protein
MPEHILVTGSMRSGTTFVGNVLSQYRDLFYLHEPFNKVWGVQGVGHWFPYAHDANRYADLADRLLEMNVSYRVDNRSGPLKQVVKSVVGGRLHWRAWYYRLVARYFAGLLIKDPLAALSSRYFHQEHDVAVVILVRHPLAFFHSNRRLGWDFDLSELRDQEALVERHLQDERKLLEKENLSYVQRLGLLWRCIYSTLREFTKERKDCGHWVIVRHEDLCLNPHEQFRRVFSAVEREMTPELDTFIADCTQAESRGKREEAEHDRIKRNSRSLVDYWKDEVSLEEAHSIRDIVGEAATPYYDEKSWDL